MYGYRYCIMAMLVHPVASSSEVVVSILTVVVNATQISTITAVVSTTLGCDYSV